MNKTILYLKSALVFLMLFSSCTKIEIKDSTEKHTVVFEVTDHQQNPANVYTHDTQKIEDGGTATRPSDPTITDNNFLFSGWRTQGGDPFDFSTPIVSDITLVGNISSP